MTDRYSNLRRGLIAAWCPSLGASGYTLIDRGGRNQHGTLTNMGGQANWPANGSGVALAFDGTNDLVLLPASAAIGSAVWASFWFRLTATLSASTRYAFLVASFETSNFFRQNLSIGVNNSGTGAGSEGTTRITCVANDIGASPTLSGAFTNTAYGTLTNRWFHLSAGWDAAAGAWRIFINGVEDTVADQAQRGPTVQPLATGAIGAYPTGIRPTPCQIDDVRLYNRALTLSETRLLASQRGIGLTPTRHRRARLAAAAATTMWLNVGGVWKATTPHIRVGGTWKQATPKIRVAGEWKG